MKSKFIYLLVVIALSMMLSGCGATGNVGPWEYVGPDMKDSQAVKAQKIGPDGVAGRMPVEDTLSQNEPEPYMYANDPDGAGKNLKNPLPRTKAVLKRGQHFYDTYCIVCHGKRGEGDGNIIPKFPRPPSLQSDKVRQWSDGRIYHVITMGQNVMPSYASQIEPKDRWAIIHYIRVLQRSLNPTDEDIKAYEKSLNNK
jgi:mono/diheme cytochrome c family protein